MEYYVLKGHDTTGPFSEEDLRRAFAGRRIEATDLIRPDNERHWTPLRKLLDQLDGIDPSSPPPAPVSPVAPQKSAVPQRGSGWYESINTNPLQAGLIGVGFAALLAFLSRWPLLVALPGLMLGVVAGLMLILRNRPVTGGIISLAAILLPIALAPKPGVPAPVFHEVAASAAPAPVLVESQPSAPAVPEVSKPSLDAPVEAAKPPADALAETPHSAEPPAPAVALPELPPVVEKSPPEPEAPQTPAPSRITPGKIFAAIMDKLTPAPASRAPQPVEPSAASPPLPEVVPVPSSGTPPARTDDLVFMIDTGTARGTGFLAADHGHVYFFTNLHVVSGAKKISARSLLTTFDFKDGNIEVASDRDLVRFAVPPQPALQFGETPQINDTVVALGNSGGREVVTRLDGKVMGVGPAQIEVTSEFIPGNSGGPLIDSSNRVVGIATYVLRGENVPDWIKAGTRFSTTRRFGVRVTDDIKWETMPLGKLVRQTALLQTGEDLLNDYLNIIHTMVQAPLSTSVTTKFPQRSELRLFVDEYNSACRDAKAPSHGSRVNSADRLARWRNAVGQLSRCIRSTGQSLRRDLGNASLGYVKVRETDLLNGFDDLAKELDKDEQQLFHL